MQRLLKRAAALMIIVPLGAALAHDTPLAYAATTVAPAGPAPACSSAEEARRLTAALQRSALLYQIADLQHLRRELAAVNPHVAAELAYFGGRSRTQLEKRAGVLKSSVESSTPALLAELDGASESAITALMLALPHGERIETAFHTTVWRDGARATLQLAASRVQPDAPPQALGPRIAIDLERVAVSPEHAADGSDLPVSLYRVASWRVAD